MMTESIITERKKLVFILNALCNDENLLWKKHHYRNINYCSSKKNATGYKLQNQNNRSNL
jgi:hypothetical protein